MFYYLFIIYLFRCFLFTFYLFYEVACKREKLTFEMKQLRKSGEISSANVKRQNIEALKTIFWNDKIKKIERNKSGTSLHTVT